MLILRLNTLNRFRSLLIQSKLDCGLIDRSSFNWSICCDVDKMITDLSTPGA